MKKLNNLFFFLAVGYMLPLLGRPSLMVHGQILLLMLAAAVIVATQPPVDFAEAREKKATDRFSMVWITALALPSMITPVVEWAYFKPYAPITEPIHAAKPDEIEPVFGALKCNASTAWILAGVLILVAGLALRVWAIHTLGSAFTSTVQVVQKHQLITSGPYRLVRHPSYLGAYLVFLGSAVFLQARVGLLVAMACMGTAYLIRIPAEERMLEANFGNLWRAYRARSKRMIPGIW